MSERKVIMPAALTAENGAKALLMGEFYEVIWPTCSTCEGGCTNADDTGSCETCGGSGVEKQRVMVGWDTIKDIYAMAVKKLAQDDDGDIATIDEALGEGWTRNLAKVIRDKNHQLSSETERGDDLMDQLSNCELKDGS